MVTAPLPPCPLCGADAALCGFHGDMVQCSSHDYDCSMAEATFARGAWISLAAPPLPPEIAALRAEVERLRTVCTPKEHEVLALHRERDAALTERDALAKELEKERRIHACGKSKEAKTRAIEARP